MAHLSAPVVKSEQESVMGFLSFLESKMVKNIDCMCVTHMKRVMSQELAKRCIMEDNKCLGFKKDAPTT